MIALILRCPLNRGKTKRRSNDVCFIRCEEIKQCGLPLKTLNLFFHSIHPYNPLLGHRQHNFSFHHREVGRTKQCLYFKQGNGMWKCSNCSECITSESGKCWKCGFMRDGSPPKESSEISSELVLPDGQLLSQVVASSVTSRSRPKKHSERQEVIVVDVSASSER